MNQRSVLFVALLLASAAVTGCGGGTPSTAVPGNPTPSITLTLIPSILGQQVYTSSPCLFGAAGCTSNVKLVSADANGKPVGGDFAAMEASGTFMTFATLGSASLPGTSEVILADLFF